MLHEVALEIDGPELTNAPFIVAAQEDGFEALRNVGFDVQIVKP